MAQNEDDRSQGGSGDFTLRAPGISSMGERLRMQCKSWQGTSCIFSSSCVVPSPCSLRSTRLGKGREF